MMRRPAATAVLACLLPVLGACKIIDQTTFNPEAGKPPVIPTLAQPSAPAAPVQAALLRIPLDPEPDWAAPLRQAVQAARQRKPTVEFDVVAVVPGTDAPGGQVADVRAAGEPAARVAQAIAAEGILPARVRLIARPQAGVTSSEIRVFVR